MSRKARRRDSSTEVARRPLRYDARPLAATSRVWPDLSLSRPDVLRPASATRRVDRVRQVLNLVASFSRQVPAVLRKAPSRPSKPVSFGAWSLPPTLTRSDVLAASTCAQRSMRREVLFALRGTGKGSGSRKRHYSNRSCK